MCHCSFRGLRRPGRVLGWLLVEFPSEMTRQRFDMDHCMQSNR